jgi:hypothetical protein
MKHRTLNVITIVFMAVVISLLLTACRSSKAVADRIVIQTDTVYQTRDSIVVKEREVPVKVEIPVEKLVKVTPKDTVSVIISRLYKSTAWIEGGLLHHELETLPDATFEAKAKVADTTKVSNSSKTVKNSNQKIKTNTIYENRLTKTQKFFYRSGEVLWAVIAGAILILGVRFLLRRYGAIK